jgi:hypothetical protein
MNVLSALIAYSFFDKKPSINIDFDIEEKDPTLLTVLS